ncbi:MAG TPA: XdhC family protein [Candidatus Eremiobacteraceae bacterium]|nr:XdhC family protein [Candidatus Eremiobacteraceae bacterium]
MKEPSPSQLLDTVADLLQKGAAFAICTVVRPPQAAGAKVVLAADSGFVAASHAAPQALVASSELAQAARRQISEGVSRTVAVGEHEVFIDVCIPSPRLLIVGAVHIAMALCAMATLSGFEVTVIDPRPTLNDRERFPKAKELRVGWPEDELPQLRMDDNTYVAVLTHDEKFDDPTILYALPRATRYVGAIGSKKTQALRRERLAAAGLSTEQIGRLRGPIGLDIGAQTPEEIAVAILSEMIAAKYHRDGKPLRDRSERHIHV